MEDPRGRSIFGGSELSERAGLIVASGKTVNKKDVKRPLRICNEHEREGVLQRKGYKRGRGERSKMGQLQRTTLGGLLS